MREEDAIAVLSVVCSTTQMARRSLPRSAMGSSSSGQHPLLGWSLSHHMRRFLHMTGASLDVDEYG